MSARWLVPLLALATATAGCSREGEYALATCVAVDVSGTYADQMEDVTGMIRTGVLPNLVPGDSLVVVRIDSASYEEANVVGSMTLDHRPSTANAQTLAFSQQLQRQLHASESSSHTDIPGAMMLCTDHLHRASAGGRAILMFSDMKEDLPEGTRRRLGEAEFDGIHVAAVHVKRLQSDNMDPELYRSRLAEWEERVTASGAAGWDVVVSGSALPGYLERIRP